MFNIFIKTDIFLGTWNKHCKLFLVHLNVNTVSKYVLNKKSVMI